MDKKTYPLHKVVQYRNIKKIKILLPDTKDINEKNDKGQTVLLLACEYEIQNDTIMEWLLSHPKIDPAVTNNDDFNALHMLAFKGHLTWIMKILDKFPKMDVDEVTDEGNTPLILAAKMNHFEIIRYLHAKGANIDHENDKKFTALSYAANNGYEETTKELLKLGAAVDHMDDYGNTPLMKAATWGFTEVCRLLLDRGANVHAINNRDQTALELSVRRNDVDAVKLFLQRGSLPNRTVNYNNKQFTSLIYACLSKNADMMKLLIEHGADVNYPVSSYSVPLFTCVKNGFIEGVRVLLEAGVDVRAKTPHGSTALDSARKFNKHAIVELLKQHY